MYKKVLLVSAFHAVFSSFGEIENNLLSIIGLPLSNMFNQSITLHYGLPSQNDLDVVKSTIGALNFIGVLIGGYIIGHSMDKYGRKAVSVTLRGILGLIASTFAICSYFFQSVELFAFSHFISGINVSLKIALIIYTSECSPVHLRGPIALLLNTGNFIIQLMLQPLIWPSIFGNETRWVFLPVISLSMCIIHLSVASFFPQSPKHLYLNKHSRLKAEASLEAYHGENVDTDDIFDHYDKERGLVNAEHLTLKQVCQTPTTRVPFIIVMLAALVPAFSALQIKSQFMQQLLVDIGFTKEISTYAMNIIVLTTTPFSFVSPYLIERLGRRPLFLLMAMLCCLEWALLTVGKWQSSAVIGAAIGFTGLTAGHLAYKLGILTLPAIILNEVVPFAAKAAVTEALQIWPVIVSMIVALTYLPLEHNFGVIYNVPFVIISITLFTLLYVLLPETNVKREPQPLTTTASYGTFGNELRRLSLMSID